jgi:membrane-associated phospholipid phosphatase
MKNKYLRFVFVAAILGFMQPNCMSQNWDIDLLRNINLNRNKELDPPFKFITNSVTPMIVAVPSGMFIYQLASKDSTAKFKSMVVCGSIVIATVLTTSLKYIIHKDRPFVTYPEIELATKAGSMSFPSGHTAAAFSIASSLSIVCPKWYVIAPSYAWAGAVGYSRMHLGAHYPSDVIAGALIGYGSAWLSYRLNKWYAKQRPRKQ